MSENSNLDVRILTLKRWALPQHQSLYEIWLSWSKLSSEHRGIGQYGDYVSFQNYHFIDISRVDIRDGKDVLISAHEKICDIRKQYDNTQIPNTYNEVERRYISHRNENIYIQQNMVLLGRSSAFWDQDPAKQLYVSMLQLSDQMEIEFSKLEDQVSCLFRDHNVDKNNWTLYYSLDFCDLVLLVKDVPFDTFQEILWNLSPAGHVGQDDYRYIRDTITIYSFPSRYLMEQFVRLDNNECNKSDGEEKNDEKVTLSISLSVQQLNGWNQLKNQLNKQLNPNNFSYWSTPGRYDIQLLLLDVYLSQAIWVLYWIDKLSNNNSENDTCIFSAEAFGGYEIVPMGLSNSEIFDGKLFPKSVQFANIASETLWRLLINYSTQYSEFYKRQNAENIGRCDRIDTQWWYGYASEISRSLIALLKNGFSEEFALSVFHSFAEYLRFVAKQLSTRSANDVTGRDGTTVMDQIYTLQREYFEALNMLMHCTMHGGQQFIQAPGFNATLFDVPPKLLAYYSGVAYQIMQILRDESDPSFSFLVVPDFRPDIYVKAISYGGAIDDKISIISLNEKMFYSPVSVVQTMCHEIAHYVGQNSRHRQERAQFLFETIACYWLNMMPLIPDCEKNLEETPRFIQELAEAMGNIVKEQYHGYVLENAKYVNGLSSDCGEEQSEYYLISIGDFLDSMNYLIKLLESSSFTEKLREAWREVINNGFEWNSGFVMRMIEYQQGTLMTDYIGALYNCGENRLAVADILSGNMITSLKSSFISWGAREKGQEDSPLIGYFVFCQDILQAFSEAYADLRMIQLLQIHEAAKYDAILDENSSFSGDFRNSFQFCLRKSAIHAFLGGNDQKVIFNKCNSMDWSDPTARFCCENLVAYLRKCGNLPNSDKLKNMVNYLAELNAEQVFCQIRAEINSFRGRLLDYCKNTNTYKSDSTTNPDSASE